MTETFVWRKYIAEPAGDVSFLVRKAQFGGGYTQRAGDGINNASDAWNLEFYGHRVDDDLGAVEAFLRARAGWQSFFWTPPGGEQGLYICGSYRRIDLAEDWQRITATFEQTFQP